MSPLLMFAIAGMGTYLIRVSAIALVGRGIVISPGVEATLRLIAPAVLAAIVADTLVLDGEGLNSRWEWYLAAALAGFVSWRWRSAGATMAVGMLALWGLLAVF
ncbi:MAG: AzlD domain-containing protein [Acidimicrobiales bacterium]